MANTITHKRSSTSGVVPAASGLSQGELAINIADGKLYTKNNANSVINLGVTSISGTIITPASGYLQTIAFNTDVEPDLLKGQVCWNDTNGTLNVALTDTTDIHVGEHSFFRVRNNTSTTLYKGQAVYASGVHSNGIINPALYSANGTIREVMFMGVMLEDLLNNHNGYAIQFGRLNIDTRGNGATNGASNIWSATEPAWSAGDILYVSDTNPGKLTKVEPKHSISVAIVLNASSNGLLFVRPISYGHLNDNHDVEVSGATNGQFLQYNSATDYWVPSSSGNFTNLTINNNPIVTGVGTSGYLSKFNSSQGVADSIVYDDGTNIGIGTSSPSSKLQVSGLITANSGTFGNLLLSSNNLSSSTGNIIITPSTSGSLQRDSAGDPRGIYAVDWQSVRSTGTMVAAGNHSVICGGQNNSAGGMRSVVCGGTNNNAAGTVSYIGGGNTNSCIGVRSTIGGGTLNSANVENAIIGGGANNTINGTNGTIGGGSFNNAAGIGSTIAGGANNSSAGEGSTIGGGNSNSSTAIRSTVAGGSNNTAAGRYSTVIGGDGAKTINKYEVAHAAGVFASAGDVQHSILIAKVATSGSSPTNLFTEASGDRLTIPADKTTWTFGIKISAYNDTDNLGAGWDIRGCIQRYNNITTLIGTNVVNTWIPIGMSGVTASAIAASGNNALTIQVVGLPSKNIRWVGVVDISQVSWGVI